MMSNAQLAAASFNDIVFDGRNKNYGAYELRSLYQRHVSRALVLAATIFCLLVFSPVVAGYLRDEMPAPLPKVLVDAKPMKLPDDPRVITPPPPPVPTTPPPPPVRDVARFTPFKAVKDQAVTETPPDIDVLKGKDIGAKEVDVPGESTTPPFVDLPPVEAPKELGRTVVEEKPYVSVEQMPELPGGGGVAAIVAAIQKAARYPSTAMRNGVEGRVYVSFVVNAKGDVTDVTVLKGLGSGLDEETIRAIKSLPRFIPGRQNGREVSVSYSVPITFKIQ